MIILLRKISVAAVVLLVYSSTFCQIDDYIPLSNSEEVRSAYLKKINENKKESIKELSGKYKKEMKSFYEGRAVALTKMTNYEHLIFDEGWIAYLIELKDQIAEANPETDLSNIELIISRYYWPNAFSIGEGSVVVNVGLVPFLESEDQLVFILCHEFAHDLLKHSYQKQISKVEYLNSKEYADELKDVQNSDLYQATKLKSLLTKNIFSQRSHSREYESEADSLALVLYLNTDYVPAQAARTMDILEQMNSRYDTAFVDIFNVLQTEPVKGSYGKLTRIKNEDYQGMSDEELKNFQTHPDCSDRKSWLLNAMNESKADEQTPITEKDSFMRFRAHMTFEMCESYLHFSRFDRALLSALRLNQRNMETTYTNGVAAYSYYKLIRARKDYELNSISPLPHQNVDSVYSNLLNVFFSTRLRTLQGSAQRFCASRFDPKTSDERFFYAYIKLAELNNEEELHKELLSIYKSRFPAGEFYEELASN